MYVLSISIHHVLQSLRDGNTVERGGKTHTHTHTLVSSNSTLKNVSCKTDIINVKYAVGSA